jgi:hypothetical protein
MLEVMHGLAADGMTMVVVTLSREGAGWRYDSPRSSTNLASSR